MMRTLSFIALPCLIGLLLGAAWQRGSLQPTPRLQGAYASKGQVYGGDAGEGVHTSHFIRFDDDHFYAMTRHGNLVSETSGEVEYPAPGHYRLQVKTGNIEGLGPQTNDEQLFRLLYSRHPGASIQLQALDDCLFAQATGQVYCPLQHD